METRFLQTLLTVMETSSLAEAARRLSITPSAVIQRIRALEEEIGQTLISRAGHAMRPTAAGVAVLEDVKRLLAAESDVRASASAKLGMGLLRIGVTQPVLTGFFPDMLLTLKKNRPGIEIYLQRGLSAALYSSVLKEELDLVFVVKPHFALPKALDWKLLQREPLVLITPHSLKGGDPNRILAREPFIRYDRSHWAGRIVDLYLRRKRIRSLEQFEIDSLEAITVMVHRGLGVSLVPDWLRPWQAGPKVRKIKVSDSPACDLGILWSRNSSRLPLIEIFLKEALACLPEPYCRDKRI